MMATADSLKFTADFSASLDSVRLNGAMRLCASSPGKGRSKERLNFSRMMSEYMLLFNRVQYSQEIIIKVTHVVIRTDQLKYMKGVIYFYC